MMKVKTRTWTFKGRWGGGLEKKGCGENEDQECTVRIPSESVRVSKRRISGFTMLSVGEEGTPIWAAF